MTVLLPCRVVVNMVGVPPFGGCEPKDAAAPGDRRPGQRWEVPNARGGGAAENP
jgi:hypothetical protein